MVLFNRTKGQVNSRVFESLLLWQTVLIVSLAKTIHTKINFILAFHKLSVLTADRDDSF